MKTYEDAAAAMWLGNSHTRLGIVLKLREQMDHFEWWRLLGLAWTVSDHPVANQDELGRAFRRSSEVDRATMMSDASRGQWAELPETFTVYRGCYANNRKGLSWSLSRETAAAFPLLHRFRQDIDPLLLAGIARKRSCVLMLDRGEQEVIAWGVRGVTAKRLPRAVGMRGAD